MLPLSYIEFVPVKQKYARVIIMSNDFFACEKYFKNVQKFRKRGGVNAKRAVEKQSNEFITKKKNHVTLNIILL